MNILHDQTSLSLFFILLGNFLLIVFDIKFVFVSTF